MAYSWSYNEIDLAGGTYNCVVENVVRSAQGAVKYNGMPRAQNHGMHLQRGLIQPLYFDINAIVSASTRAAALASVDALVALLSVDESYRTEFDLWTDRYWMTKVSDQIRMVDRAYTLLELEIQMVADYPFAYSTTLFQDSLTQTGGTVAAEDLADGNMDVPILLTLDGASDAIVITNDTTGDSLSLGAFSGEMTVDSNLRQVQVDGSDFGLGKSGTFPVLTPGVANVLSITGFTGTCDIEFRERFR